MLKQMNMRILEKAQKKIEDWYENPAADDTRQFYGGDLQGVIDKMDYLENQA